MSQVKQRHLYVFEDDATPEEVYNFLQRVYAAQFTAYPFAFTCDGTTALFEDAHDLSTFMIVFAREHKIK